MQEAASGLFNLFYGRRIYS